MNKRIAAVWLALALLLTGLTACSRQKIVSEGTTADYADRGFQKGNAAITLGYSADDSLNPFFADTDLNQSILSLLYESPVYLDDHFAAQPCIAASWAITAAGSLRVQLDPTAVFWDGTRVGAADVVYSFNCAKSSDLYSDELDRIEAAAASGSDVIFSFDQRVADPQDSLFFPIVKNGTAQSGDMLPVGSGRYRMASAAAKEMTYSPYARGEEPEVKTIRLNPVSQESTLVMLVESGAADACFDDFSSGSYYRTDARLAYSPLPNLVFLGINSESVWLDSADVRAAMYYAVNRPALVRNAYHGIGVESYTPFYPEWHRYLENVPAQSNLTMDLGKAQQLIRQAGVSTVLQYTLIVNGGNPYKTEAARSVATDLGKLGVRVQVAELEWDAYLKALSSGSYDFYLGEVKLPANMDIAQLVSPNSGLIYGIGAQDTTAAAWEQFYAGNLTGEAFMTSFTRNAPFVPLLFRRGALLYSEAITPAAVCGFNNHFQNIAEWEIKE